MSLNSGEFLRAIFGTARGFVCIATIRNRNDNKEYQEVFYRYPEQLREMHEFVERSKFSGDIYFCPQLLSEPKRLKTSVATTTCVWADLDTCHPRALLVAPTIVLESSPNRYQAFWSFDEAQDPSVAEELARRIAYRHAKEGADRSGWDLTQLLRIPGTRNWKYGTGASAAEIKIYDARPVRYRPDDFDEYPQAEGYEYLTVPFPQLVIEDGAAILNRNQYSVSGMAQDLFHRPVAESADRSTQLFRLEMLCAEAGLSREDAFQVARDSACNKWPDRPDLLWKDVCRAFAKHEENARLGLLPIKDDITLVDDGDRKCIEDAPGFVERYIAWARTLGDAALQYHQAGAFIALSSLLASSIVLPTSFGRLIPNLWIMLLADTTLTRKSTAMDITMDLIEEIDENLLMATDGSLEGLMTSLSMRPGKVSIFLRDEFTGLMEQMTKKDYMAGMPEFFTKLYDGRTQIRRLRKEEIKVKDPRLIIFAGGIKSRMQQLVTFDHVSSGFLPRFVFVTAISDPTKVRPLGPPTGQNWGKRDVIKRELEDIYRHYQSQVPIVVNGKVIGVQERQMEAHLTDDAWRRFNRVDQTLMHVGMDSGEYKDILVPMYARLSFSMLKVSVLLAAARQRGETLVVEEEDIARASYYGEHWRVYAQDLITHVGRSPLEHKIELVAQAIHKATRLTRSVLMQRYHLTTSEMTLIARTLEERGQITVTQYGRTQMYQSMLQANERILKRAVDNRRKRTLTQ